MGEDGTGRVKARVFPLTKKRLVKDRASYNSFQLPAKKKNDAMGRGKRKLVGADQPIGEGTAENSTQSTNEKRRRRHSADSCPLNDDGGRGLKRRRFQF